MALALALAGCGSFGAIGLPWQRAQAPAPVSRRRRRRSILRLPPASDGQQQAAAAPGGDRHRRYAPLPSRRWPATTPAAAARNIGRTDLLGGWTITSGGNSCQLFMTLTSWTGGYRASTRGCTSDVLKSISAWNLQGRQVVLAGQGGTPVAHLASSGTNRFDGQIDGQGTAVSFYR